jgi:tetratricopeptide (TPR) repeat protein
MSVIYLQLSLYYEAKYFAYIANEMNSIPPRMIWVSAISRLDNPLLLAVLQNELNHIQEMLNKEKVSETLLQYRGFLIREYVLCNKKQGRYDESIDILKQMIENNDDIDFAKSELKEIYKLRKIQNNQTNNQ